MAEQFYTIITKIGKAKIANATALGTKVNLTKFQVGDGNGSYYNPTEDQLQLRKKVWEGNISSITVDTDNPNWIVLETIIPGDIGGFMIREAAALDDEGNIIAIGKYPETYKPLVADGSTKDLYIRMILEVSNTSSLTLKVDPTVILATKKDIEILDNKIKNITASDIKTSSGATVEASLSDIPNQTYIIEKAKQVDLNMTNSNVSVLQIKLTDYSSYASSVDSNGIYTVVDYKRADGTLYMKSTLSGGTSPNYTTDTWKFYGTDGTTLLTTKTWTITYDANGKITSKVVA